MTLKLDLSLKLDEILRTLVDMGYPEKHNFVYGATGRDGRALAL